ncbi:MAG: AI-2E family transporter [Patescibacteria group bacterium]|nr:AI-2E family transporter [Patescibacteria group bacterium]
MKNHFNTTFLFALILLVGYGSFLVFKPFVIAITLAFVLSQLFQNWYKKTNKLFRGKKSLASLVMCVLILFIIVVPLIFVSSMVISETNHLLQTMQQNNIQEKIEAFSFNVPVIGLNITNEEIQSVVGTEEFMKSLRSAGGLFLQLIKKTYQSTSSFLFMSFVMFFSLYYFFKDSNALLKCFMNLSPLKNSQEKLIVNKFIAISRATLKGTFVVAIVQGTLLGISFFIAGVPSATLWALVAAILSLVPLLGTLLVWAPVGVFLLLIGKIWQGIFIILFGAIVVSNIDNFLRPKLVGNEAQLHPLLVFLSTLGGIAFFGIAGFLLGPVIIVLFMTLLQIYQIEFKKDLKVFNK